jgi:hypothetical protein
MVWNAARFVKKIKESRRELRILWLGFVKVQKNNKNGGRKKSCEEEE